MEKQERRSVRDRYLFDPMYRNLVDTLEKLIHEAQLTPSEVREAAMQACINYEMRKPAMPYKCHE